MFCHPESKAVQDSHETAGDMDCHNAMVGLVDTGEAGTPVTCAVFSLVKERRAFIIEFVTKSGSGRRGIHYQRCYPAQTRMAATRGPSR
jgi:hypothetical protein